MKGKITQIFKIIILPLIIYLTFAFGNWNINAKYWAVEDRAFCVFIMLAATILALIYFILEKEEN